MLRKKWIPGGVAEMMPKMIAMFRELGLDAHWLVIQPSDPVFFSFTKRLHNLIHGVGEAMPVSEEEASSYQQVSETVGRELSTFVQPRDIVVIHDPQPMGAAKYLTTSGVNLIWRCHIGLDDITGTLMCCSQHLPGLFKRQCRPRSNEYCMAISSLIQCPFPRGSLFSARIRPKFLCTSVHNYISSD